MTYMDHLRAVALAGVALIVQKTQTYGPSWKRRRGPGAWFTTVRPWDRLETIVDQHDGDVFAAIEADPSGADGSALACIRDMRNYLLLIEAEMAARGVVHVPPPTPNRDADEMERLASIQTMLHEKYPDAQIEQVQSFFHPDTGKISVTLILGRPETLSANSQQKTLMIDAQDALEPGPAYVDQDLPAVNTLGAGPIVDGRYTLLDLGQGTDIWSVGLGALPDDRADYSVSMYRALGSLETACRHLRGEGCLVASRALVPTGGTRPDHQILIRIPAQR